MNVVAVNKEIGNLITLEDFNFLDLGNIKERVQTGMVLAHDQEIRRGLRRDGVRRLVFRGPDALTVESERSIYMTTEEVIAREVEAFSGLIARSMSWAEKRQNPPRSRKIVIIVAVREWTDLTIMKTR